MAGNAGMGRPRGSLNKRTTALMAMVEAGGLMPWLKLRLKKEAV